MSLFEPVLTLYVTTVLQKHENLNLGSGQGVSVEEVFQISAGSFLGRQKTSQLEKG